MDKERLMFLFIDDEFGSEPNEEVKRRMLKPDKVANDYIFIFFNTRKKTLFSLQNLLWRSFLRTEHDYNDLMFVAEYIPNLRERALEMIFKKRLDFAKTIRLLNGYVCLSRDLLKKFALWQNIVFEAENAFAAPIKNEKRLQIKQFTREALNAFHATIQL